MLRPAQKMLLHIYAQAAALDDPSYRAILREHAGVESSASKEMDNKGFDRVISSLERVLFDRVRDGRVKDPRPSRYISDEFYWRRRCGVDRSTGDAGFITTRQAHRIDQLWKALLPTLPIDKQTMDYLKSIMIKSTGKPDIGLAPLTHAQANLVINALGDRVMHARHPEESHA